MLFLSSSFLLSLHFPISHYHDFKLWTFQVSVQGTLPVLFILLQKDVIWKRKGLATSNKKLAWQ